MEIDFHSLFQCIYFFINSPNGTKLETNLIDLYEKNVDVNCLKVFRILKNTMSVSDILTDYHCNIEI